MLKLKTDFDNLFLNKSSYYSSFYIIYYRKNNLTNSRFGISISKKNEKRAVFRNKAKRQIKVILSKYIFKEVNFDLIVIVKKNFFEIDFQKKKDNLESLLNKIFIKK